MAGDSKHPLLTAGERAVTPAQNISSTVGRGIRTLSTI
jgi:hypothetical protein